MDKLNEQVAFNKPKSTVVVPTTKRKRRNASYGSRTEKRPEGIKPWLARKFEGTKQKKLAKRDVCLVLKEAFETQFPDLNEYAEMTVSSETGRGGAQSIMFTIKKTVVQGEVIIL
jgi:hypothetical protein